MSQVCLQMKAFVLALEMTIQEDFDRIPAERRSEIGRLAKWMWREIVAVQQEAQAVEEMLSEPAFAAFKDGLIKKPKRTRKPRKAAADHQEASHA